MSPNLCSATIYSLSCAIPFWVQDNPHIIWSEWSAIKKNKTSNEAKSNAKQRSKVERMADRYSAPRSRPLRCAVQMCSTVQPRARGLTYTPVCYNLKCNCNAMLALYWEFKYSYHKMYNLDWITSPKFVFGNKSLGQAEARGRKRTSGAPVAVSTKKLEIYE